MFNKNTIMNSITTSITMENGVATTVTITAQNPYHKIVLSEEINLKEIKTKIEELRIQMEKISEICGGEYTKEVETEIENLQNKAKKIIELSATEKAAAFQLKIDEIMELASKSDAKLEITFGFHDEDNKKTPLMIIRIGRTEIRCIKDRMTEANIEDLNSNNYYNFITKAIIKKTIDIFNN